MDDDDDAWPDVVEETMVQDTREPETQQLSDYAQNSRSLDPEDLSYMTMMMLLQKLNDGHLPILALSDRVTSHMVVAVGFFIDERSYRIIYNDPWGADQSFLEQGKNAAGVAAKRYGEYQWSVSHHELRRILDSFIAVSPRDEAEDGQESQD